MERRPSQKQAREAARWNHDAVGWQSSSVGTTAMSPRTKTRSRAVVSARAVVEVRESPATISYPRSSRLRRRWQCRCLTVCQYAVWKPLS